MKYYVSDLESVESVKEYLGMSLCGSGFYSEIMETTENMFYIVIRKEDLHLLSDEQMAHVFDSVKPKEQEIEA